MSRLTQAAANHSLYKSTGDLTDNGRRFYSTRQIARDFKVTIRQLQDWRDTLFLPPNFGSGARNECHYEVSRWAAAGIAADLLNRGAKLPTLKRVLANKTGDGTRRGVSIEEYGIMALNSIALHGSAGFLVYQPGADLMYSYTADGATLFAAYCKSPVIVVDITLLLMAGQ